MKRTREEWEADIESLKNFLSAFETAEAALLPRPHADYIPDREIARHALNEAIGRAEEPAKRGGALVSVFVPQKGRYVEVNVVVESLGILTQRRFPIKPEQVIDSVQQAIARLSVAAEGSDETQASAEAADYDTTTAVDPDTSQKPWAYDYSDNVRREFFRWLFGMPVRAYHSFSRGFTGLRPKVRTVVILVVLVSLGLGYLLNGWDGVWQAVVVVSALAALIGVGRQMDWW